MSYLSKIARFVVWVCAKFTRAEIERISTDANAFKSLLLCRSSLFSARGERIG